MHAVTRSPSAASGLLALALAVGWLGGLSLALQSARPDGLAAVAALTVASAAAHVWLGRVAPQRDPLLVPSAVLLCAISLVVIARVAPNFLARQTTWMMAGMLALCLVASSRDRLRWLRRFKYTWLLGALALLAATLVFGVNPGGSGAPLWLSLAGVFLQPSELLRLLLVAFLAAYYAERLERPGDRWADQASLSPSLASLAPGLMMAAIALALLAMQQDLGAGALLFITFLFLAYLASGRAAISLAGLGLLATAIAAGAWVSARVGTRLAIWLDPFGDAQASSFQIAQSLIAVASGGVFGQGVGQGFPGFVPAVHTDFPFVAVAEELGLVGVIGLMSACAALVLRAWRVARTARDAYELLLAGGIAASFAAQIFVIVGGNLAVVPLTGVTLPFVSYGGSSLLVSFIALGVIVRVSADPRVSPRHAPARSRRAVRRSAAVTAAMLGACVAAAAYWGVVSGASVAARDDNPRRVLAERAIARGPILAGDGRPLALSEPAPSSLDPTVGRLPVFARRYPITSTAPVVGYASLRYGLRGLEAEADGALRGGRGVVDGLLHRPVVGQAVTSTIDAEVQQRVVDAMTGMAGAAVVLDARDGAILAMVSQPFLDPNTIERDWDRLRADPSAPLVNRAVDGAYPPGGLGATFAVSLRAAPLAVAAAVAGEWSGRAITPTALASALPASAGLGDAPRWVPWLETAVDRSGTGVVWLVDARDGRVVVAVLEGARPEGAQAVLRALSVSIMK